MSMDTQEATEQRLVDIIEELNSGKDKMNEEQ